MIASLFVFLAALAAPTEANTSQPLEGLLNEAMQGCVVPDLRRADPRIYFAERGWRQANGVFTKRFLDHDVVLEVRWPSTREVATSCSFTARSLSVRQAYEGLLHVLGQPADIPWDENKIAGWRINTNGHAAGIYISRQQTSPPAGREAGLLVHILQN